MAIEWHPNRLAAKLNGLKHYSTGEPCCRGHTSLRMVNTTRCLECHKETQSAWRERNPEKHKSLSSGWKSRNRDRCNAYARKWSLTYPERTKKRAAAAYIRNIDKAKASRRKYYLDNPEKFKVFSNSRRARVRNAPGSHTAEEVKEIFEAQKGRCAYCRCDLRKMAPAKRHLDHITSLSKGGSNDRRNLQFLCPPCNNRKHATDPIDFAQKLGMLL